MIAQAINKVELLSAQEIEDVALGKSLYVSRQLLNVDMSNFYASCIVEDPMLSGYGTFGSEEHESKSASAIRRGGLTCYEACSDPILREVYLGLASKMERHFRDRFAPHPCPMDMFQKLLSKDWKPGVESEFWRGKPMPTRVSRVLDPGEEALPHTDVLWRDKGDGVHDNPLVSQLAVNIYLAVPPQGGELDLFGIAPTKSWYESHRLKGTYGLDRKLLPDPLASIKPLVGEVIVFNPLNIHAVRKSIGGQRSTLSCFVGYRGASKPLTIWS
jgi:hypothetical protein